MYYQKRSMSCYHTAPISSRGYGCTNLKCTGWPGMAGGFRGSAQVGISAAVIRLLIFSHVVENKTNTSLSEILQAVSSFFAFDPKQSRSIRTAKEGISISSNASKSQICPLIVTFRSCSRQVFILGEVCLQHENPRKCFL